jgi:hypothetical protein
MEKGFDPLQLHLENELLLTKTLIIKKIISVFAFYTSKLKGLWFHGVQTGFRVQNLSETY